MAPSKYITLVSAEGYEYVLPREACHASQMLRTSVDPDKHFRENRETVVNLPEMRLVNFPLCCLTLTCRIPSALSSQIVLHISVDDESQSFRCVLSDRAA